MKGLLLPSSLPNPQRSHQNVKVSFFETLKPKDPRPNKWFGEPGLDSPQLTSCLRIKWDVEDAPDNIKK